MSDILIDLGTVSEKTLGAGEGALEGPITDPQPVFPS